MSHSVLWEGKLKKQYIKINNSENKIWILPVKNLQCAFALYQPTSKRGNMIKKWLPLLMHIPVIKWVVMSALHIENINYSISNDICREIETCFKEYDFEELSLAFFLGTPSVHQKVTIQIAEKGNILGYCKISDKAEIWEMFQHEKQILDYLHKKEVIGIPRCLFCGQVSENKYAFIQTTKKSISSKMFCELKDVHIQFVTEMITKTKQVCTFEDTDYYERLIWIENNVEILSRKNLETRGIEKIIHVIKKYFNDVKEYSVYHGDFTPWNVIVESNELFAFDFEYAKKTYPCGLDLFHFFSQIELYQRESSVDEIIRNFQKTFIKDERIKALYDDAYIFYLAYLIDVISMYTRRDYGDFDKGNREKIEIRLKLIETLMKIMNIYNA